MSRKKLGDKQEPYLYSGKSKKNVTIGIWLEGDVTVNILAPSDCKTASDALIRGEFKINAPSAMSHEELTKALELLEPCLDSYYRDVNKKVGGKTVKQKVGGTTTKKKIG